MKSIKIIVIVILSLFIIKGIIFPAHIHGGLDFLKALQGWHLEDDYERHEVGPSKYVLPGMFLTELSKSNNSEAEVATYGDIAIKYKSEFKEGDLVTVYIETYSNPINHPWFKGKIISIDKNYIPLNNYPSIKYKINIIESSENVPSSFGGYPGSMVNSSEDGDAVVLDRLAIRQIGAKKYVCVISETQGQDRFLGGNTYIMRFKLKEIQAGTRVYTDSGGSSSFIDVSGLSPNETVLTIRVGSSFMDTLKERLFSNSNSSINPHDFYCGKP